MSNGDLVPSLVEDDMIFVAYDTHLYFIHYLSFLTSFAYKVGWARMLELLYYWLVFIVGYVGLGQLYD